MISVAFIRPIHLLKVGFPLLGLVFFTACERDRVSVYKVAKESSPKAAKDPHDHTHDHPQESQRGPSLPRLTWATPGGWEEAAPGEMRYASFRVQGEGGQTADVGVFPLPGMAGTDLGNVNRWRGQVGLEPVTEEQLAGITQAVVVGGQTAKVYDLAGENPGSGDKTRILAAILRREGIAWFIKMTGDDSLVAGQKAAFNDFLKSLKFSAAAELPPSHPPIDGATPTISSAGGNAKPEWQVPSHWKEAPAGQFLVAKYTVGEDDAQAAVNVSMSPGDGGGFVGNVNRWRRQVGLDEQSESDIVASTRKLETSGGAATLVDITGADPRTNQKTRVLGAVLPRGGQTWFYKLMGPEGTVAREAEAFNKFIQTAKYNAS